MSPGQQTLHKGPATPERSFNQRMDALARANEIRSQRAQLKRDFLPVVERLGDTWNVAVTVPKTTLADRLYALAGVGGQYDPYAFETLLAATFLPFESPRALAHAL